MVIYIPLVSSCKWFLAKIPQSLHVWIFLIVLNNLVFYYIRGHVLSEDTYYRTVTEDQVLISKRLLAKTNKLPRWGERIFSRGSSSTIGFIVEESVCDLKQRIFTTKTININLKTLMVNKI